MKRYCTRALFKIKSFLKICSMVYCQPLTKDTMQLESSKQGITLRCKLSLETVMCASISCLVNPLMISSSNTSSSFECWLIWITMGQILGVSKSRPNSSIIFTIDWRSFSLLEVTGLSALLSKDTVQGNSSQLSGISFTPSGSPGSPHQWPLEVPPTPASSGLGAPHLRALEPLLLPGSTSSTQFILNHLICSTCILF